MSNRKFTAHSVADLKAKIEAFRLLFECEPVIKAEGRFIEQGTGETIFCDVSPVTVTGIRKLYVEAIIDGELVSMAPKGSHRPGSYAAMFHGDGHFTLGYPAHLQ